MQPEVTTGSQLIDSLKVYLNDKKRQQPIIGLKSIIECVKVGVQHQDPLYLCEVCVSRLRRVDIKNHILGTQHRFNFIKTQYPHLVAKWEKKYELSEMAWHLMDVAKKLESKEGTGEIQLIEADDGMFQWMEAQDEADVGSLIKYLRNCQSLPGSMSLHYPAKSERIVLLPPNQEELHEQKLLTDVKSGDVLASTDESSENKALWISQDLPLENILTAERDAHRSSHGSSMVSADGPSFLDGYTGIRPLHGLSRVVECRVGDGSLCCFLCHSCCIRANQEDIISHLTSSSHLLNYLMEVYPEQMDVDFGIHPHILDSLVKRVQQDGSRGALKVVTVPESLCGLLTCRSYHWCYKMLCKVLTNSYLHKRTTSPKVRDRSRKYPAKPHKWAKKNRRRRNVEDTVFNVSLPLTEGVLLLERTSFSTDGLPSIFESPLSDEDDVSSAYLKKADCDDEFLDSNGDNHAWLSEDPELQQDVYSVTTMVEHYPSEEVLLDTLAENTETCETEVPRVNQHDQLMYEEGGYNSRCASQTPVSQDYYESWQNEDHSQTEDRSLMPSVSPSQSMVMLDSVYRHAEVSPEQQYRLPETSSPMWQRDDSYYSMNTIAVENTYNHYYQNQHMPADSEGNGQWGHRPNKPFPFLNSAKQSMTPCVENQSASSGESSADPRIRIHFQTKHKKLQPHTKFSVDQVPSNPQGNGIQLVHQYSPVDHTVRPYSDNSGMDQQQPHFYSSGSTPQGQNSTETWWSHSSEEPWDHHDSGPNLWGFGNPPEIRQNPSFTPPYASPYTSLRYASSSRVRL